MKQVNEYTKANLTKTVYFPKGKEICRYCPFCVADGNNHRREACMLTGSILVFADLSIEGNCPLHFENER